MEAALAIIALIGVAAATYTFARLRALERRFTASLGGVDTVSLETTLAAHLDRVERVDARLTSLTAEYERLAVTGAVASQKIAIIRFNPFGDSGGDQSFVLAVLDAHDSGYVLTSIHGRDGTRMYAKPVDYGQSKYTLSVEEKQALALAIKRVPKVI